MTDVYYFDLNHDKAVIFDNHLIYIINLFANDNRYNIKFVEVRKLFKRVDPNSVFLNTNYKGNFIGLFQNLNKLEYFNGEYICDYGILNYNTDINSMFDGCYKLRMVNLSHAFSNIDSTLNIQLNGMFKNFLNLFQVNLDSMFQNTKGTKIISCKEMFENCLDLTYVNIKRMFNKVDFLEELDLTQMFANCKNLYSVSFTDFLSNCDKLKLVNIGNMFENCVNLKCIFLVNPCGKEIIIRSRDSFVCNVSLDINEFGIDYYSIEGKYDSFCNGIITTLGAGSCVYVSYKREMGNILNLGYYNTNIDVITIKDGKLHKKYKLNENNDNHVYKYVEDCDMNVDFLNDVVF